MRLVLEEILDLAASGAYEVNAALSDESAALILSMAVSIGNPWHWIGAGYELTDNEIDVIHNMIAQMVDEVMTEGWIPNGGNGEMSVALIVEEQTQGTHAGTFTSGAWRTRVLNMQRFDPDSIVSVASDRFTLPEGKYLLLGFAPAYRVNQNQAQIYDITNTAVVALSMSMYARGADNVETVAVCGGYVDIAGDTVFELQHRCATTVASWGFGLAANLDVETYSMVLIIKVD